MGLGDVLVRKVFFKSRNFNRAHDSHERHLGADRSMWSSVRHYFCGDEFNSLLAEDDFSSPVNTETTVVQSVATVPRDEEITMSSKTEDQIDQIKNKEKMQQIKFSCQEKAAIVIQTAFRCFRERKRYQELKLSDMVDDGVDIEQQSETTEALSTIVQVGDFSEAPEARDPSIVVSHCTMCKARIQMCRIKEWDDSTLSSNALKLRIQNRIEAMTRRERALAYAFSRQLRACSKKKPSKFDTTNSDMGWTWLERWMAARPQENWMANDCVSRHLEPIYNYKRSLLNRNRFDVSFEEKESCGSNDVPVSFQNFVEASQVSSSGCSSVKSMFKATKSVTRRRIKASKGDSFKEI